MTTNSKQTCLCTELSVHSGVENVAFSPVRMSWGPAVVGAMEAVMEMEVAVVAVSTKISWTAWSGLLGTHICRRHQLNAVSAKSTAVFPLREQHMEFQQRSSLASWPSPHLSGSISSPPRQRDCMKGLFYFFHSERHSEDVNSVSGSSDSFAKSQPTPHPNMQTHEEIPAPTGQVLRASYTSLHIILTTHP